MPNFATVKLKYSTTMKKKYLGKTIGSLLIVLLLMPLGHALMILMEHFLEPTTLHYSAFLMGFVGLVITIAGVFVKGDTRRPASDSPEPCSSGLVGWSFCSLTSLNASVFTATL